MSKFKAAGFAFPVSPLSLNQAKVSKHMAAPNRGLLSDRLQIETAFCKVGNMATLPVPIKLRSAIRSRALLGTWQEPHPAEEVATSVPVMSLAFFRTSSCLLAPSKHGEGKRAAGLAPTLISAKERLQWR